jgi:chemotaxis protein methyltransferase CheR
MTGSGDLARFRALLATRLGWTFDDSDAPQLANVLGERAHTHRLSRAGYLAWLGSTAWDAELAALAEELTVNETYFFRHGEQFRALADVVLPERIRTRSAQRVLRMVSVGCASGEEAYTLAIVARELRPEPDWIVSVLGLDVNPVMLHRAMTARYSTWSLRETPDAIRQRWFHPHDGDYELAPMIRAAVRFRQYNVADADEGLWGPERYDVLFCRNLLMYLTPAVRETLLRRMTRSLAPGGCLFLGHTDSLGNRPEGLDVQYTHGAFYYRRPAATAAPRFKVPAIARAPSAKTAPPPGAAEPDLPDRALRLLREERFADALKLIEAGPADLSTPRDLLMQGVLLAHTGRLDAAELVCRQLLDIDGLYADAHHQLAVCLEGGTAVDVAIGHYRLAAYLDPDFAMPRLRLGLLARRRGEHRVAGTALDQALALLRHEHEDRIVMFGGGFGRAALTTLCRAELDACEVHR